jgi:hypothetical protein
MEEKDMEPLISDKKAESLPETHPDPFTDSVVDRPTHRQERFLRRQHRWRDDLTQETASGLIADRLAELRARRRQQLGTGAPV